MLCTAPAHAPARSAANSCWSVLGAEALTEGLGGAGAAASSAAASGGPIRALRAPAEGASWLKAGGWTAAELVAAAGAVKG